MRYAPAILLFLAFVTESSAEEFSSTDVQLLRGNIEDGASSTLTLEHYGGWEYGYNYFFTDLYDGQTVRTYTEWESQLSLGKLLKRPDPFGPFKDIYFAAQFDRGGNGFYANLFGVGAYFDAGKNNVAGIAIYSRKDKFNAPTYQVSPYWFFPFHLGSTRFVFTGYLDFSGTDSVGLDTNGQPQLLLDVGKQLGGPEERFQIGGEWFLHRNDKVSTDAFQGIAKWIW